MFMEPRSAQGWTAGVSKGAAAQISDPKACQCVTHSGAKCGPRGPDLRTQPPEASHLHVSCCPSPCSALFPNRDNLSSACVLPCPSPLPPTWPWGPRVEDSRVLGSLKGLAQVGMGVGEVRRLFGLHPP